MGFSGLSIAESRNPPYAISDVLTNEETASILRAMPPRKVTDYNWMDTQKSLCHDLGNTQRAEQFEKEMNASLRDWAIKMNEIWAYRQRAASKTANSLKRPRSSEGRRETDQDPSVNNAETDGTEATTCADPIFTSSERPQAMWPKKR